MEDYISEEEMKSIFEMLKQYFKNEDFKVTVKHKEFLNEDSVFIDNVELNGDIVRSIKDKLYVEYIFRKEHVELLYAFFHHLNYFLPKLLYHNVEYSLEFDQKHIILENTDSGMTPSFFHNAELIYIEQEIQIPIILFYKEFY